MESMAKKKPAASLQAPGSAEESSKQPALTDGQPTDATSSTEAAEPTEKQETIEQIQKNTQTTAPKKASGKAKAKAGQSTGQIIGQKNNQEQIQTKGFSIWQGKGKSKSKDTRRSQR